MKKVITTAALLFSGCTFIMAQDTVSEFKPGKGANNLELNFVPLNGKPIQMTYIRFRRFLDEKTAIRLGVGISYSSTKEDVLFALNITSPHKIKKMGWELKPGLEKHFAGTKRLSPYFGAELDLAGQSSKEITPTQDLVSNAIIITTVKNANKGGFIRVGLNAVAGFDCYVTKHLYLGTELGFGFQMVKYSKITTTTAPSPVIVAPPVNQGNEVNFGPNFNSAIRLGYIF